MRLLKTVCKHKAKTSRVLLTIEYSPMDGLNEPTPQAEAELIRLLRAALKTVVWRASMTK